MIARIFIYLILFITLPDLYLDRRFLRKRTRYLWWQRVLWWLPGAFMFAYTIAMATSRNFAPDNQWLLHLYLLLLGVLVGPKFIFAFCSFLGWAHCRYHHTRTNWGNLVGLLLSSAAVASVVYGGTFGFRKLEVRHEVYASADLPKAFDGYKIVQFSDAHVGTYGKRYADVLERAVDSINAQGADMVVFTGDLQNMEPKELYPVLNTLGRIRAKDGVYSVLGNHDYSGYIKADNSVKVANEREMVSLQRQMGWDLLMNEHRIIRRGTDSIVVAGMENDGRPPHPHKGDIGKTLTGIGLKVFGWSPAAISYKEWDGMYYDGNRAINVSAGVGGFIPFRLGASNEIVVITLRSEK